VVAISEDVPYALGALRIIAVEDIRRQVAHWLKLSAFAEVPRPVGG
jgi:hypothetical protein